MRASKSLLALTCKCAHGTKTGLSAQEVLLAHTLMHSSTSMRVCARSGERGHSTHVRTSEEERARARSTPNTTQLNTQQAHHTTCTPQALGSLKADPAEVEARLSAYVGYASPLLRIGTAAAAAVAPSDGGNEMDDVDGAGRAEGGSCAGEDSRPSPSAHHGLVRGRGGKGRGRCGGKRPARLALAHLRTNEVQACQHLHSRPCCSGTLQSSTHQAHAIHTPRPKPSLTTLLADCTGTVHLAQPPPVPGGQHHQ